MADGRFMKISKNSAPERLAAATLNWQKRTLLILALPKALFSYRKIRFACADKINKINNLL
jgi:hypothetical protein